MDIESPNISLEINGLRTGSPPRLEMETYADLALN